MEFHFVNKVSQTQKDTICLWAPPSHGNVGQIALDNLLISAEKHPNTTVKYIAFVDSDLLLPLTG